MISHEFANPFKQQGTFFKGNLHTHTTESDGLVSVNEAISIYESKGYDFLALTDHWKVTRPRIDTNLLLITGEEMDYRLPYAMLHMVALNLQEEIPCPKDFGRKVGPHDLMEIVKAQRGKLLLAHPYWSGLSVIDMLSVIDACIGIEVFNTTCQLGIGKGYSMSYWDNLLVRGKRIFGFATDDSHWHHNDHRPLGAGSAWIMVKCEELSLQGIMNAICSGFFYSSCGPVIQDVTIEQNNIHVQTSPVRSISFIAPTPRGEVFSAVNKHNLTSARYIIRGEEKYVRIQCIDEVGKMAWTNPIFLRDIEQA